MHAISDEPKLTKWHGSLQSSCDVKILYIYIYRYKFQAFDTVWSDLLYAILLYLTCSKGERILEIIESYNYMDGFIFLGRDMFVSFATCAYCAPLSSQLVSKSYILCLSPWKQ